MIRGYPNRPTVIAGSTLSLHVATNARRVRILFFRCGERPERIATEERWFAAAPELTRYDVDIPTHWRAGVYVGVLVSDPPDAAIRADPTGATLDARSARILFVVREERARGPLLVALPLFTYHAYNVADVDGTKGEGEGDCLYSDARWVSLHRPGGGIGGHPWDEVNIDVYDRATPRQTFAHWDAKGIAWLERAGYGYDCCTDLELHDGSVDLTAYRAILSFGHHEYWTRQMRKRIDRFIRRGGNAAFFGGNTCWFELEYDPENHAIRRVGRWNGVPEWKTTGVSYAFGGGKWIGPRPEAGYRVANAKHWLFNSTGFTNGETFGAQERLIGYECDGAPPESDLEVLAEAKIHEWPVADGSGEVSPRARASLGVRLDGGMVFTASTVDWARVLGSGEPAVNHITRNVLDRFIL